jgi:sigma-E factor negative regulatory protein RseB
VIIRAPVAATVAITVAITVAPLTTLILTLAVLPASATPAPSGADDEQAVKLLARSERAPRSVPYSGVQFVSSWGRRGTASLVVEVRHWPAKGTAVWVRNSSDGSGGEVFQGDPGDASGGAAQAGSGPLGLVARNYEVFREQPSSVAGRRADVVVAYRGTGSVAARFWLDAATGLLLRREVYDSRGTTVRASSFVDISVGDVAYEGHLPPMLPGRKTQEVTAARLAQLRAAGWECREKLPLGLHLYDARETSGAAGTVVHLSYSDGLSTVSLFEQRGHLDKDRLGSYGEENVGTAMVYTRSGVPLRMTWSAGGIVYSVLADAPDETVQAVVEALPHEEESDGFLGRVRRGLGRFVSWLNPFG